MYQNENRTVLDVGGYLGHEFSERKRAKGLGGECQEGLSG